MNNVFFLEFLPTRLCNQSCPYCDLSPSQRNITKKVEMDLDYFKWIINSLQTNNLMIEICGGEPGLVSNLEDALLFLKDHKSVVKTQLMSNGLIRYERPELLTLVDSYNEHLIKNIHGEHVEKFYDMEFDDIDNTKYVIVLSEQTTKSLLYNFDRYEKFFNEDKFWLKLFVERSTINNHKKDIIELFQRIDSEYAKFNIERMGAIDTFAQTVCAKFPWLPCISLEDKKIIHCAYHNFTDTVEKDVTLENLDLLVNKRLFYDHTAPYCQNCYHYHHDPLFLMRTNKSNQQI